MLVFPNAKINLGLNILDKRSDGYHNLSSVFYPINIHDSLEVLTSDGTGEINLYVDGVELSDEKEANFVYQVICQFGLQTKNLAGVQGAHLRSRTASGVVPLLF